MANPQQEIWPAARDMDRIWNKTQRAIGKKAHRARVRRTSLLAGGGVLVLGVTAAAIVIPATQNQIDNTSRCYSAQSTTSEYADMGQADGQDPLGVSGAISGCGAAWAYGMIIPGKFIGAESENDWPVTTSPPLGACLNPNNTVAVFPLDDGAGNILSEEQLCAKVNLRAAAR